MFLALVMLVIRTIVVFVIRLLPIADADAVGAQQTD